MKPFATAPVLCLLMSQPCTAAGIGEWIDDNRLVVGNETGAVILTGPDFDMVEIIPTASPYPPGVRSGFHVSSDGAYLTTGFQAVEIWNIENGEQAFRIPFSNGGGTDFVRLSPGHLCAARSIGGRNLSAPAFRIDHCARPARVF